MTNEEWDAAIRGLQNTLELVGEKLSELKINRPVQSFDFADDSEPPVGTVLVWHDQDILLADGERPVRAVAFRSPNGWEMLAMMPDPRPGRENKDYARGSVRPFTWDEVLGGASDTMRDTPMRVTRLSSMLTSVVK